MNLFHMKRLESVHNQASFAWGMEGQGQGYKMDHVKSNICEQGQGGVEQ